MNKLLVLGIGNMLLTDDGVGVFASQELMKEDWPEQVTIREGGTFTQDIFYSFKGYSHLLVLDVVHCGGKPGTLYRLTEDALIKDDKQRLSIHDIDLIDSLRMAEKLFGTKSELLVLGVEPKDYVTWNIGLSDDVQAVFPEFLALARKEIGEWLKRYGNLPSEPACRNVSVPSSFRGSASACWSSGSKWPCSRKIPSSSFSVSSSARSPAK